MTIAASSIGGDEKLARRRIQPASFVVPPTADGGHSESSSVMIRADIDKPSVPRVIVDAVRIGARYRRVRKVMPVDVLPSLLLTPLPPFVSKVPDEFLLLGVDRDYRPALCHRLANFAVNVSELVVTIRMILSLLRFPVSLQAVTQLVQILGHLLVADRMLSVDQFSSQGSGALTGPPEG